ncbi:putative 2-deoxy-D-gluconate 3-dehydrogenase [Bisporella sp. PMI_857]|nr:putative 2-deoxy-D-gluconate 3-dehydrogenase [Bisporella sp. PMI_857]
MQQYLSDLFGLKGKTVLITGGTRGIGKALSVALAAAGAHLILIVRNPQIISEALAEIKDVGGEYHIYPYDLSSREQVLRIVTDMTAYGHEIDAFVHCAGIQYRASAEDFPDAEWDNILNVNLTAGFQLSRALAKHWLNTSLRRYCDQRGTKKKIVFIASVMSFMGGVEIPAYTASKGAIAQLTKALNNEWMGKGINVNAIAPGYIETELTSELRDDGPKEQMIIQRTPIGRWGRPEDLAGPIIHLCSSSSDYIGGEIHTVDGGFMGR